MTEQIVELVKLAREEGELVGEQFLHWFLQEQREEVASMTELLAVVERGKDNLLSVEEHLSRAAGGAESARGGRSACRRRRALGPGVRRDPAADRAAEPRRRHHG